MAFMAYLVRRFPESFCDLASLPLPSLGAPAGNDGFPTEAPEELRLVRGHDMSTLPHSFAVVITRPNIALVAAVTANDTTYEESCTAGLGVGVGGGM